MKSLIFFFVLFSSYMSMAQTYSRVVSDSEIIDFINSDLQRDSVTITKTIRKEIIPINKDDYYYSDSADFKKKNSNYPRFIFGRHIYREKIISHNLDTLFTRSDIDFFLKQIEGIRKKTSWKKPFNNSLLVDNVALDSDNHAESTMHCYSLPLFSADKKRVIITKGFFCGLLCGGMASYIYERKTEDWILIRVFNEYGE